MKCRECYCCEKGWFKSKPNAYVCIGVQEPFVIKDINVECTEYPEYKDRKVITEDCLIISFDNSPTDPPCMIVSKKNGKTFKSINTLWNEDALRAYKMLIGME